MPSEPSPASRRPSTAGSSLEFEPPRRTAHSHASAELEETSAAAHERCLVAQLFDRAASELLDAVEVAPGDQVLELACGTGAVTRHAARRAAPGGLVVGVGINPGMLALAAEQVRIDGGADVHLEEASAEALPVADGSIDVACCQQGLQFVTDPAAALAELHRVTVPGGRLALSLCRGLEHQPGHRPLVDVLAHHVGADAATGMASPFALGDMDVVRTLVRQAGFDEVRVRITVWPVRVTSPQAFFRGETASSPLGEVTAPLDADVVAALLDDFAERLTPYSDDVGLSFPFESLVITATR